MFCSAGQVLPATLSDVRLWAELTDGRRIQASRTLPKRGQYCQWLHSPIHYPKRTIQEADYIIIGPGSLYTSVIPNLLVPEIAEAIAWCRVGKPRTLHLSVIS